MMMMMMMMMMIMMIIAFIRNDNHDDNRPRSSLHAIYTIYSNLNLLYTGIPKRLLLQTVRTQYHLGLHGEGKKDLQTNEYNIF